MEYTLSADALSYVKENLDVLEELIIKLCKIPAPSNMEEKRAAFCRDYLEEFGAQGVYIDPSLNVVLPINCETRDDITVFMAHTDTVFPELEPFSPIKEGGLLKCPGVGDDTANLAMLLLIAKYIVTRNIKPNCGLLLVCNSGEEGLGNLKGSRRIMEDYAGRIARFISFDGSLGNICNWAVGSMRYEITATTQGGHSFGKFGNRNAIEVLASLITDLYAVTPPARGKSKTTYNVGTITGGTSVNTIAQEAKMLYEFRSDDKQCLSEMEQTFNQIIEKHKDGSANIQVNVLGVRPCMGNIDAKAQRALEGFYIQLMEKHLGKKPKLGSGSTDCNIPFSLGVPSICCGFYSGEGAHTYEEYIELASLKKGFPIAMEAVLASI